MSTVDYKNTLRVTHDPVTGRQGEVEKPGVPALRLEWTRAYGYRYLFLLAAFGIVSA